MFDGNETDTYFCASESTRWVLDQLKRFTYRPNWTWTARDLRYGSSPDVFSPLNMDDVEIRVWFEAEDTRRPGETVKVGDRRIVPEYIVDHRDGDMFALWFAGLIRGMEDHESREWLRRDGNIYDDPHAKRDSRP